MAKSTQQGSGSWAIRSFLLSFIQGVGTQGLPPRNCGHNSEQRQQTSRPPATLLHRSPSPSSRGQVHLGVHAADPQWTGRPWGGVKRSEAAHPELLP